MIYSLDMFHGTDAVYMLILMHVLFKNTFAILLLVKCKYVIWDVIQDEQSITLICIM
jgi:hypothetical protein